MEETTVVMFPGHEAAVDTGWSPRPTGGAMNGPIWKPSDCYNDDGRSGCRCYSARKFDPQNQGISKS